MCGIAGLIDPSSDQESCRTDVARMGAALASRGPDGQGRWSDDTAGVHLAHQRLAVIDVTETGAQPMSSADGRYVIVYNGETYNHRALRNQLSSPSLKFRGTSDTEVLLEGFSRWGVRPTLERSIGMFALAVWDREDRRLVLARDRIGEKPLYYGHIGDTFVFGSELAAITAHPAFSGRVDRSALAAFLRYGNVPASGCIWEGVYKLRPGHFLEVRPGDGPDALCPRPYWRAAAAALRGRMDQRQITSEDLERLLQDTVARTLLSDVPLGVFLSGGIDSSLVAALAQNASERPIRTFTIGFREAAYDEAEDARKVAEHLGTDHTTLYVTPGEARDVIPELPRIYSEPFADSSQIPTYLVSRMAREHVTVALSGDGGDELFGGYNRYTMGTEAWNRAKKIPKSVRRKIANIISETPHWLLHGLGRVPSGERVLAPAVRPGTHQEKLKKMCRILGASDESEAYRRLLTIWDDPPLLHNPGKESDQSPREDVNDLSPAERWMLRDAVLYLPDDILVKVDRAAMAVSLETRAPFLSHEVFEAAWRLPMDLKIRDRRGKWILREILAKYVPRELFERPKTGFGVPIDSWLRGPLKEWAEALLDPERIASEGYLDPAPIRAAWEDHQRGRRDRHHELWAVLMFQAWLEEHRHLIEDAPLPEANAAA